MPFHAGSLFDAGPWRPLDRNARRIWLTKADRARRDGHITALHVEIGRALLRRLGADGPLDPSHETIAADAGCCARTVGTALRRLRALGLLAWTRRMVRVGRRV